MKCKLNMKCSHQPNINHLVVIVHFKLKMFYFIRLVRNLGTFVAVMDMIRKG